MPTRVPAGTPTGMPSRLPTNVQTRQVNEVPKTLPQNQNGVPSNQRQESPSAPSKQQHDVPLRAPSREQHEGPRLPSRGLYNGPRVPPQDQHNVPRSPSREHYNAPNVPTQDRLGPSRVISKEPQEVPRVPPREQHDVPRARPRGPYNVPKVPSQDHHGATRVLSKEQHDVPKVPSRSQNDVPKMSPQDHCDVPRAPSREQYEVLRVPPRGSHDAPKMPPVDHRDVPSVQSKEQLDVPRVPSREHPNVPGFGSRDQHHIFISPAREQYDVLSRAHDVPQLNQHDLPRALSRERHEVPRVPSVGHHDVPKVPHLDQLDVPWFSSREQHIGPMRGQQAPMINEHHIPRAQYEVQSSMGIIDLTREDTFPAYTSQSTDPVISSRGFSRIRPHALDLSEPQRAMQQIQRTVCNSYPDNHLTSALQSHHDRQPLSNACTAKVPDLYTAREKSADHIHTKAKARFHPYMDDLHPRVTHSPSLESVEEHFDEWRRRQALVPQPSHAILSAVQTASEQDPYHFLPSQYTCIRTEPDYVCSQERRKEGNAEQQEQPEEKHYADKVAFQSCWSPTSVSGAGAFTVRSPHASSPKENMVVSVEQLYSTSRIFMPSPQMFSPSVPLEMMPMSPSVLAAAPLIPGPEEQFHIHPHCLMASAYSYPVGTASIPYPLHSFT